jgi:hypothetical protein
MDSGGSPWEAALPTSPTDFEELISSLSLIRILGSEVTMGGIIYLVGLVVVIMFVLSLLGLR